MKASDKEAKVQLKMKTKKSNNLYTVFANIFKAPQCDEELYAYLKEIAVSTNQVCAKRLNHSGSWSCKECEMDSTCIICNECYENSKDIHKGHQITFKHNTSGCCDCGDPDAWKPSGFCSKHKGTFSTEKEIQQFIEQSFKPETVAAIQSVLMKMINEMIGIINSKTVISIQSNPQLNQFITFFTSLCESNQALLHIVSDLLTRNYPFQTRHQCFKLTMSSVEIVKHNANEEPHQCSCSFIQILFQLFGSSQAHEKFLYLLLHNYKAKVFMGLSLFSSFDVLDKNKCSTVQDFSVQIITEEISEIILSSPALMIYIADKLYEEIQASYSAIGNFRQVLLLGTRFYYDLIYLLKPKTVGLLKNHLYFYKRILDIIALFHNSVVLTVANSFQTEAFTESDIRVEIVLLELVSLLMTVFDYSNEEQANALLAHFIEIFEKKKLKQLNSNQYSFHITFIRAFSLFLSHYAFSFALTRNTDVHFALRAILEKTLFSFESVIREVFKLFGFVLSCKLRYWIFYAETSVLFSVAYTSCGIFSHCDFSLIKLLCSMPQYAHLLSINSVLSASSVRGSYEQLQSLLVTSPEQTDKAELEWSKENNSKNMLLGQEVLILLMNILRMNDYFISLLYFSYEDIMKNKVESDIHKTFISKEHSSIADFIRSKLAHVVISNENYCLYSDIIKELSYFLDAINSEKEMIELLNERLDKSKGLAKEGVRFSLKPQYYHLIDLSLLFGGDKVSKAQRYITDFKSKEISFLQTVTVLPVLNCTKLVQKEYEGAFYSVDTAKWLLAILGAQLTDIKWEKVGHYYLFYTLKLLQVMVAISKSGNEKVDDSIKILSDSKESIISLLDKPSAAIDSTQREYCHYFRNELIDFTHYTVPSSIDTVIEDISSMTQMKKAAMLSKYRKKFKEKTMQFHENRKHELSLLSEGEGMALNETNDTNITNVSIITETKKTEDSEFICVLCRLAIDPNKYDKNPYGRFGIIVNDLFLRNIQIQTIKRAFNEEEELCTETTFASFIKRDPQLKLKTKQKRLLTCNHYAHFNCYEDFMTQSIFYNEKNSIPCPFCKLNANTFIPMLPFTKEDKFSKGLSFNEAMDAFTKKQLHALDFSIKEPLNASFEQAIHRFIEDFLSFSQKESILISDITKSNEVLLKAYSSLVNHLKSFFIFYDNYSVEQISLMNTLIYSFRLLVKTHCIQPIYLIEKLFNIIKEVCELDTSFIKLSDGATGGAKFTEALLLFMLLFDESEDDEQSIQIILYIFLPSIFVKMFIAYQFNQNQFKLTSEHFISCITNSELGKYINSDKAKSSFNTYLNKLVICKRIMHNTKRVNETYNQMSLDLISKYNANLDELNLSDFKSIPLMSMLKAKYPPYWPKVINPYGAINNLMSSLYTKAKEAAIFITPSYFSIGLEYHYTFISLPGNILELASQMSKSTCAYCDQLSCFSLLCLTCGRKVCYTAKCTVKKSSDSPSFFSFLYHSEQCGGGNAAFLVLTDGEILFLMKRKIIKPKLYAYLNQFGEGPKTSNVTSEYLLNQFNIEKAQNMFVSYSYRRSASDMRSDILGFNPEFEIEDDSDMDL